MLAVSVIEYEYWLMLSGLAVRCKNFSLLLPLVCARHMKLPGYLIITLMQQLNFSLKKSHCTIKLSLTYSNYDDGHGKLGTLQREKTRIS